MARGKPSMAANVNKEDIVATDENTGSVPFYLIDDEWGIAADEYCYALCRGKVAHKKEIVNGKEVIVSYKRWSKVSYYNSIWSVLKGYAEKKEKIDLSQLKTTDIGKIAQISESIKTTVEKKMNEYVYDTNIEEIGKLEHTKKKLMKEVKEIAAMKDSLQKEYEETMALLKQIRSEKLKTK